MKLPIHQFAAVPSLGRTPSGLSKLGAISDILDDAVGVFDKWAQAESDAELAKATSEISVEAEKMRLESNETISYDPKDLPGGVTFNSVNADGMVNSDQVQDQLMRINLDALKEKYQEQLQWGRSKKELDLRFAPFASGVRKQVLNNTFTKKHNRIVAETIQSAETIVNNVSLANRDLSLDQIDELYVRAIANGSLDIQVAEKSRLSDRANIDYTLSQQTLDGLVREMQEGTLGLDGATQLARGLDDSIKDSYMTGTQKDAIRDEVTATIAKFEAIEAGAEADLANADYAEFLRDTDRLVKRVEDEGFDSDEAATLMDMLHSDIEDSNMSETQKNSARDGARQAQIRFEAETARAEAEFAQQQVNISSNLRVEIGRGNVGELEVEEAFMNGDITAVQRGDRLMQIMSQGKAARKKATEEMAAMNMARDPNFQADPREDDHIKAVDLLFEREIVPSIAELPTAADQTQAIVEFITLKGVIPTVIKNRIRGVLRGGPVRDEANQNGDAERKVEASDLLLRIQETTPNAVKDDFRAADIMKATHINTLVTSGVGALDAVTQVEELQMVDRRVIDLRQERVRQEKHFEANETYINSKLLTSGWFGFDPPINDVMEAEFGSLQEFAYMQTGDLDTSQTYAANAIKRVWAVSEVGGEKRMMKYAPEHYGYYPLPEQNSEWMQEQLSDDLAKIDMLFDPEEESEGILRITADPITAREASLGIPSYQVSRLVNGAWLDVIQIDGSKLRWTPDWNSSKEKVRVTRNQREAERQKQLAIEEARLSRNPPPIPHYPSERDPLASPVRPLQFGTN